jgi:hypothetical protein
MVFSTNQARHLYVVSEAVASLSSPAVAGEVKVGASEKDLYFEYVGADKVARRSDLIPIDSITYAKATKASALAVTAKAKKVTLAADALDSGKPIPGNYTLKVAFRQYNSMSDEGYETRVAEAKATSSTTAAKFYAAIAVSLFKNLSKEIAPLLDIYLAVSGNDKSVKIDANSKVESLSGSYTGITLIEAGQPWVLGTYPFETVDFDVIPGTIALENDEIQWGVVASATSGITYGDGKKIADLEYFCLGERGDVYRNVGWPNSIKTDYQVNPAAEYDVLDIHYAYQGTCEDIQKSEKDITFVGLFDASNETDTHGVINKLITKINSALSTAGSSLEIEELEADSD